MKNIVLLGGSNSVMINGLQKGLREYANVTNLALGGSTSIQNLYELYRPRNQEAIKTADLIVTESNINEIHQHLNMREQLDINIIFRNMQYLYSSLYCLQKPVCIILLPTFHQKKYIVINNMHKYLANFYGFCIISLHDYYKEHHIVEFGNKFGHHQLNIVNRILGQYISKNINSFISSNKQLEISMPDFQVITPENMKHDSVLTIFNPKNSVFDEITYRLKNNDTLKFINCFGYQIIGIHSWLLEDDGQISKIPVDSAQFQCGSMAIITKKGTIIKSTSKLNRFFELQVEPIITEDLTIGFNHLKLPDTEFYSMAISNHQNSIIIPYFDLIAFLLCKPNPKMKLFDLSVIPTDKDVEIDPELDRSYLIPNIVFFKDSMEFIDEYISHLYPNIVKHMHSALVPDVLKRTNAELVAPFKQEVELLKEKIQALEAKNSTPAQPPKSATPQPIPQEIEIKALKEKLAQKEQELINMKDKFDKQNTNISILENNYQKALNTKNHLSYKLGQALIKANKNWYKGGYVKFIFEVMRIKKEHKNRG